MVAKLLVANWTKLWKSYSVLFSIANILQAVSVSALAVLGVINVYFAFQTIFVLTLLFGALGLVGRLISQPSLKRLKEEMQGDLADDGILNGSNKTPEGL